MNLASYINGKSTTLSVTWPSIIVSLAKNALITISFPPQTLNYINSGIASASMVAGSSVTVTY